jgi:hypothetical protein
MLIDLLQDINEGRTEKAQGSSKGREKFASKKGTKGSSVKSRKSRVKVYDSIKAALKSGAPYGTIFSTKSADRLYVISKPTWGDKSRAGGNSRIAKGFTPGAATPSASWPSIKSHAVRTALKHGGSKSKRLTAKYGPGKERPEEKRYSSKKAAKEKIKKIKEARCPASSKIEALLPMLKLLLRKALLKEDVSILEYLVERASREDLERRLQGAQARLTPGDRGEGASARNVVNALKKQLADLGAQGHGSPGQPPPNVKSSTTVGGGPTSPAGGSTTPGAGGGSAASDKPAGGEGWATTMKNWMTKYNKPENLKQVRRAGRTSFWKSRLATGPRADVPVRLLPRRAALKVSSRIKQMMGSQGGPQHHTA